MTILVCILGLCLVAFVIELLIAKRSVAEQQPRMETPIHRRPWHTINNDMQWYKSTGITYPTGKE